MSFVTALAPYLIVHSRKLHTGYRCRLIGMDLYIFISIPFQSVTESFKLIIITSTKKWIRSWLRAKFPVFVSFRARQSQLMLTHNMSSPQNVTCLDTCIQHFPVNLFYLHIFQHKPSGIPSRVVINFKILHGLWVL